MKRASLEVYLRLDPKSWGAFAALYAKYNPKYDPERFLPRIPLLNRFIDDEPTKTALQDALKYTAARYTPLKLAYAEPVIQRQSVGYKTTKDTFNILNSIKTRLVSQTDDLKKIWPRDGHRELSNKEMALYRKETVPDWKPTPEVRSRSFRLPILLQLQLSTERRLALAAELKALQSGDVAFTVVADGLCLRSRRPGINEDGQRITYPASEEWGYMEDFMFEKASSDLAALIDPVSET
jgi:hypothetical protein